jgi:KUP system potassium uptake protein
LINSIFNPYSTIIFYFYQNIQLEHEDLHLKVTPVGLLIALGIIYGDIGTSPLYTMKAIIGEKSTIDQILVYGGISCIFWTLTLQTTVKYVFLTLKADNNGEGGIFSLYALLKDRRKLLTLFAVVGGSALLADGIITPPISVSSAIEGLRILKPDIPTVPIVVIIISLLFALQILGTSKVGKYFGPLMLIWFSMLGVIGLLGIVHHPEILFALNPYYAFQLLVEYPEGFWILGAVFLCTTGAEALYSDMGHCGRGNIRVSWVFVKICLLLNYLGQGGWLMTQAGKLLTSNPFYAIMPQWFLLIGISIATLAAIIASQALISGSFTLISEAVRLNLWPKVRLLFPSNVRGQLYVPSINIFLWVGCLGIVFLFRESANMEAAYGLSITITMLMTTLLLSFYLSKKGVSLYLIGLFVIVYLSIELSFLAANLLKFMHGGYVSLIISSILIFVMWVMREASTIKESLTEYVELKPYIPLLQELSVDQYVPKYATHLIYMSSSSNRNHIEEKIVHSILEQRPKRADIYWFIHVETTDKPFTMEYKTDIIAPEDIVRVTFRLGFRVEQRIGLYFRQVLKEMIDHEEINIKSRYQKLNKEGKIGDFIFLVIKKFLSYENKLPPYSRIVLIIHFLIKKLAVTEQQWFGLDEDEVVVETTPLVVNPIKDFELKKIY